MQYFKLYFNLTKKRQNFDGKIFRMNLNVDEIRSILSEILKLLSTPEFQTQLEKSRQASANDAVGLLQSVSNVIAFKIKSNFRPFFQALPIISRAQQEILTSRGMPGQQAILDFNLKARSFETQDAQVHSK